MRKTGRKQVKIRFALFAGILTMVTGAAAMRFAGTNRQDADGAGRASGDRTRIGDRRIFPADNAWNQDVSALPVDPHSDALIQAIGRDKPLHPDFGGTWQNIPSGIPFVVVGAKQAKVPVHFEVAAESDPGPYPIPDDAPIEGGANGTGDRHVLLVDRDNGRLYELFDAHRENGAWRAGSGAIFDLNRNTPRPAGWTSADAAGLPIFPGLARYEEVGERKEIRHALRFTCRHTRRAYIAPATHFASRSDDANLPPMGMRVRLKRAFDVSRFPASARVILTALQKYGMILADNGSDWFVSGAPDSRWNVEELAALKRVKGGDFEVVPMGAMTTK